MARLTFPVPPTALPGSYASGWNARHIRAAVDANATTDWRLGWYDADKVPDAERRAFNDTSALSHNGKSRQVA